MSSMPDAALRPVVRSLSAILDTPPEHNHFAQLIQDARHLDPIATAVVCPEDADSLAGALLAARFGLIHAVLIGNERRIRDTAHALGMSLAGAELVQAEDSASAAAKAVDLVHNQRALAIMKGQIHSDELLAPVVKSSGGLRKPDRRITHVFLLNIPSLDRMLYVTDAAINVAPTLETKAAIVQNAIDLARACGHAKPRVAIMSATETVNPAIPSSGDAALLTKMADRGQITGGLVDGPLAMDLAVNPEAVRSKNFSSCAAGCADILVVPNIESGNMLVKSLTYFAGAQPGGLVLGARCPIMLTSRSDSREARLASCAMALLYQAHNDLAFPHTEPLRMAS